MSVLKLLPLCQADQKGVGNKARHLARLMEVNPTLFSVPDGVVVLSSFSVQSDIQSLLDELSKINTTEFAVRSCGLHEDSALDSMAGKFHTELHVKVSQIGNAILKVRESFGEAELTSAVLVQRMITPDFAGVMFTRSPENYGLASCEFSQGLADAVVSGKVDPIQVDYGRWTGALYPTQATHYDMLSLLFLVGMILEDKMGAPQDIEWAYDVKQEKLYILQSREITAQVYDANIAAEQERVAFFALQTKAASKGQVVFEDSAVREVVQMPTRLTSALIQKLYSPLGSLGAALSLLKLPYPKVKQPYVLSVFGRLYAIAEMERKLFGVHPRRLWRNYRLKRKVRKEPEKLLGWLKEAIATFPAYPSAQADDGSVSHQARLLSEAKKIFVSDVYPIAYAATILAQTANEVDGQGSLTSQLMSDLSRLHHTQDTTLFLQKWGHRSANDYELSEPRFCESEEDTKAYAATYASFSWGDVMMGEGFLYYKELAKDEAVRWLYPLRQSILRLEAVLGLEKGLIFNLDWDDIDALANGEMTENDAVQVCKTRMNATLAFARINLGSEISLGALERLEGVSVGSQGLSGKMVSVHLAFKGKVRHYSTLTERPLLGGEVLLSPYLEPALVGSFANSVGCLSDVGGSLSHAAIVAREFDYPIVVLDGGSQIICDGDYVEVSADGSVILSKKGLNVCG